MTWMLPKRRAVVEFNEAKPALRVAPRADPTLEDDVLADGFRFAGGGDGDSCGHCGRRVFDCEMGSTDFRFQIARQYMHHDAGVCYFDASSTMAISPAVSP